MPRSHEGTHWSLETATTLRAGASRVNAQAFVGTIVALVGVSTALEGSISALVGSGLAAIYLPLMNEGGPRVQALRGLTALHPHTPAPAR